MITIREELETATLLEKEFERMQTQLKEAQARELKLIESQNTLKMSNGASSTGAGSSTNKSEAMSNFTKNLLMSKDKEIESLRQFHEKEKDQRQNLEDQLWKLQTQYKQAVASNNELEIHIQEVAKEIDRVKESRDKAERNVDELKEKLRVLIREQQESQAQNLQAAQKEKFIDEIERRKYEELIQMILEMDLAKDPLSSANLSLQESFVDEFEQAQKHLQD